MPEDYQKTCPVCGTLTKQSEMEQHVMSHGDDEEFSENPE